MIPLSTVTERSLPIEIDTGSTITALKFSANGEYLVIGENNGVQVWRAEDGKQVAAMATNSTVTDVTLSEDGKWIASATWSGDVFVWSAKTYEDVFKHELGKEYYNPINGVDFSPDSTRLVSASHIGTAIVFDLGTREPIQTLRHEDTVRAAKYAPQGDRIATASDSSVRVWDSSDGRLLVHIPGGVIPWHNTGLLWFDNHLFVVLDEKIRELDASTGSTVSERTVLDTSPHSRISLPKHGSFIAYATKHTVTFFDTLTQAQLGQIHHHHDDKYSISFSSDQFLAIGGEHREITIASLFHITDSIPLSRLYPTFQEPDIHINIAALDFWKHDQLDDVDALLTAALSECQNESHQVLASRALARTRLRQWDAALVDAEKAISIQPSVIGYIAKSIAHVGNGEKHKGYQACDVVLEQFHSHHGAFLHLIKAIIICMAGEHREAIARMDDLITAAPLNSIYYMVQAYMYLLLGNSYMECSDYESAIQSFEHARAQMRRYGGRPLQAVSLISGWKFDDLHLMIRQCLSEALYAATRITDAVECFHEMTCEFGGETDLQGQHQEWVHGFRQRSSEKLEHLGDTAASAQRQDEAVSHYTIALSLDPPSTQAIRIKRNKAFAQSGSWKQALDSANQAIVLNPSSPWGYEMKYAASHMGGDYLNAVDAFEVMLSKFGQSSDHVIQQFGDQYISPSITRATIRKIVQRTLRRLPRVLINTATGRLHDRAELASAFESLPIFNELVSSMTKRINYTKIKREVQQYFRYVMLSHKWEEDEPLYQQVMQMSVYDLGHSPTHDKLQTFCKIVRDGGFPWAWTDTCCINKSDHFVLQEALVAMFKWYQGSIMVIVFLRGVRSSSQLGALVRSIWNTRSWTLQEYVAAKMVHFYTEDWTLYLDLKLSNHKLSPEVISEMEQATGVSAEQLMALRPGLTNIREKLRLASMRQTTLVEDAAYSLLGIFSAAGIPAIYGEGEAALGRLLANVLTRSGDVSILAWAGESGPYNSCLPAHISVFNGPATSHLPVRIRHVEMVSLHASSFDVDTALRLYDRLNELHMPRFAESRLTLPCIAFPLSRLSSHRTSHSRVYRTDTDSFGMVEIKTRHDLSRMGSLYIIHPWLGALLEHEDVRSGTFEEDDSAPLFSPNTDDEEFSDEEIDGEDIASEESDDEEFYDASSVLEPDSSSFPAPVRTASMDRQMRARQFVAHLRQPFGALLLRVVMRDGRVVGYKRVAADSMINVQFQENFSLAGILDNVRIVDIL